MDTLILPFWYDLHAHLRQGALLQPLVEAHLSMGCAGVLAMPNTSPPITRISEGEWSVEGYHKMIIAAGGDKFDEIIIPLYLTKDTTAQEASKARAAKYYPLHGTTGSSAASSVNTYIENGVFATMEASGTILCVHGEVHDLSNADYFSRTSNAEEAFYKTIVPKIVSKFPDLKIVCEHITTKVACDFVASCGENVAATITPQHLLYTIGDMLRGLKYHLHCMPVVKFKDDRDALLELAANHPRTFAGTDSAPHAEKITKCGCAAGCFTGGYAPQLYAMAFDSSGTLGSLEDFLCNRGAGFYNIPISKKTFTLSRTPSVVNLVDGIIPLPLGMGIGELPWSISL